MKIILLLQDWAEKHAYTGREVLWTLSLDSNKYDLHIKAVIQDQFFQ